MFLLDRYLGQVHFRNQDCVRFLAACGRLQSLRISSMRRFKITPIERCIALNSQGLGHHAVILQFARETERLVQITLGFISPARQYERLRATAEHLGHPESFVFYVAQRLEGVLLRVDRRPEPPLIIE